MNTDELKIGFARLAEAAVARPDPYGRLLARARRRRWATRAWVSGAVATLLAGVVAGGPALSAGFGRWFEDDRGGGYSGYLIGSEWAERLLTAAPRGNLSGDGALMVGAAHEFDRLRPAALPETSVLLAHELGPTRMLVLAFRSADRAAILVASGRAGASARELSEGTIQSNLPPTPFLLVTGYREGQDGAWYASPAVGLAPPGCVVATSRDRGSTGRVWRSESTGDYLVRETVAGRPVPELWQVTCDNVVRHRAPAARVDEIELVPPATPWAGSEVATAPSSEPPIALITQPPGLIGAVASWTYLTAAAGLGDRPPELAWSGAIPGDPDPEPAVLIADPEQPGPLLLQRGAGEKIMVAVVGRDAGSVPNGPDAASRREWSLAATGIGSAGADRLFVVRVPERDGGRAVPGDRVLVVADPDTTKVSVTRGTTPLGEVTLNNGVGVFGVPYPAGELRFGSAGSTVLLNETGGAPLLFGEALIEDW